MVRAALEKAGNPRKTVLIPDSAHGTNPASAHFAGYKVRELKSNARGTLDLARARGGDDRGRRGADADRAEHARDLREPDPRDRADRPRARGATSTATARTSTPSSGVAKPGAMGIDVMHMNLHKTFSTPHGGGGPGVGPGGRDARSSCRSCRARRSSAATDGTFFLDFDRPDSIGRLRTFLGNFGMFVRALAYIAAVRQPDRRGRARRGPERELHPRRARRRLPPEVRRAHRCTRSSSPTRSRAEHGVHNDGHRQAADGLRLPSADDLLSRSSSTARS